ncbi:MAG: two-component system regulatory protein YycI [Ignavibacteriales bacterium]
MNWARVKTILIICFLIVNIFLLYKVSEKYNRKELKADEILNLKNLLSANDIILNTTLPSQIKYLPRMKVTNRTVEENQIADKILGINKWTVKKNDAGIAIYSSGNREIKFDSFGFVEYTINIGKVEGLKLVSNEIKAKETVKDLLKKYLKLDKYIEDNIQVSKAGIIINFSYVDNNREILNNYIVSKILPEGKIIIKHGLVDSDGLNSKNKKITLVDALVELVRVLKDKGKTTIKEISLGYYADLNKGNETIRFGEADPSWKIETDKGIYIFDAYTGDFLASFNN